MLQRRNKHLLATRADSPHLTWWQWVGLEGGVAVKLGGRDELLHAVHSHEVAEVGVAKLSTQVVLLWSALAYGGR